MGSEERRRPRQRRQATRKFVLDADRRVGAAEPNRAQASDKTVAPCTAPFCLRLRPEPGERTEMLGEEVICGSPALRLVVAENRHYMPCARTAARHEDVFDKHRRDSGGNDLPAPFVAVNVRYHAIGTARGDRRRRPRKRPEVEAYLPAAARLLVGVRKDSVELKPLRTVDRRHRHEYLLRSRHVHGGDYSKNQPRPLNEFDVFCVAILLRFGRASAIMATPLRQTAVTTTKTRRRQWQSRTTITREARPKAESPRATRRTTA